MPLIQDMPAITITTPGVEKLLRELKPHKAAGPDEIPARVLKECATSIAPIPAYIFTKSLETGDLPDDWREANISPIFKKGKREDPANYRPISLTSISSKLLEHIVHRATMNHLENNNLLSSVQHGFRRERSCETQLTTVVQDIASTVGKSRQVDAAILDFSKAFDTVPHQRLLYKLDCYGIRGETLRWISNFLTNRSQSVILDGTTSNKVLVTSGVPRARC
jgi:hypothetical protein